MRAELHDAQLQRRIGRDRYEFKPRRWRPPSDLEAPMRTEGPLIRDIVCATAEYFSVPLDEVLGYRRWGSIARIRQIAMYLAREMTVRTFNEIAYVMNNRHYSTIVHAHRKISNLLVGNAKLARNIEAIKDKIKIRRGANVAA